MGYRAAVWLAIILALSICVLLLPSWPAARAQGPTPTPVPTATPVIPLPPGKDVRSWYDFASDVWNLLVVPLGPVGAVLVVALAILLAFLLVGLVSKGPEDVYKLTKSAIRQSGRWLWQRTRPRPALSPPLRDYLDRAVSRAYRFLDLKSLDEREGYDTEVRLRQVYIPLRGRGSRAGDRPPPTEADKLSPHRLLDETEREPPPLTHFLPRSPRLVVLGRAGSGKSTFLKYVAGALADAHLQGRPGLVREWLGVELDPLPIPIYFPLRDFGVYWQDELKRAEKTESRLAEALLKFLVDNFGGYGLDQTFFTDLLTRGRCLIFLDGLDEVRPDLRPAVVQVVEAFVTRFASADVEHPNRCVVACRPEAYRGETALNRFDEVEIQPLDRELAADFVRRWYREVLRREGTLADPQGAQQEAEAKTASLLAAIDQKEQVRDLTQTPLLLTLVAIIHHRQQLPDSRKDLYERCTRLLLEEWEKARPGEAGREMHRELAPPQVPSSFEDRVYYLEPAAYWLLETGQPEAKGDEWARAIARLLNLDQAEEKIANLKIFLRWAAHRSNLLEERADEVYAFAHHRTFQEYLAARYLARRPDRLAEALARRPDRLAEALARVPDPNWRETLRLLAAVLDPDRRQSFLGEALDRDPLAGPLLAGECLAEIDDERLRRRLLVDTQTRLLGLLTGPYPAADRAAAGDLLGRPNLGDPRFDPGRLSLPDEPGLGFIEIPPGPFWLGSREKSDLTWDDELGHSEPYDLPYPYSIARYPVTVAQFAHFVGGGGYESEAYWTGLGRAWLDGTFEPDLSWIDDEKIRERYANWLASRPPELRRRPMWWDEQQSRQNHPVTGVTWFEAMAYCAWLTAQMQATAGAYGRAPLPEGYVVRLPTEPEWEKAARGGLHIPREASTPGVQNPKSEIPNPAPRREWPWAGDFDPDKANTEETGLRRASPVGAFPGGASPYGCLDLAGNVWEWCHSLWAPYPYNPTDGREAEAERNPGRRVVRGGSWIYTRRDARCASRNLGNPVYFSTNGGFRLVLAPRLPITGF